MTKVLFSVPIKDHQLMEFKNKFPVEFIVDKDDSDESLLTLRIYGLPMAFK